MIYRNKYTTAVGFGFAQPTERARVERSRNLELSEAETRIPQVFSFLEIT
ncbi:hypothetical protein G7B40_004560 [Aetokthonos hydrillicola Thurmond2011]|uniref:Uncharacterized protein n=1 Tax=Aetokthonos hydrillicola Thurmond2011 TaxID=2712845 RepID=A0AAP5I4Z4_9CYAN|nr:hypothetical protein [Aetokthonos hydrillicola Thurmond2011]